MGLDAGKALQKTDESFSPVNIQFYRVCVGKYMASSLVSGPHFIRVYTGQALTVLPELDMADNCFGAGLLQHRKIARRVWTWHWHQRWFRWIRYGSVSYFIASFAAAHSNMLTMILTLLQSQNIFQMFICPTFCHGQSTDSRRSFGLIGCHGQ